MLERLTAKFSDILREIGGKAHISEKNIRDAINEIKIALLEADVNLRVVRRFVNRTVEEAVGESVLRSVSPAQQFTKIVHDRLMNLLGDGTQGLELVCLPDTKPTRTEVIAMFIAWAKDHPQYWNEPAVETEFRFLMEKWPCNP